MNNYQNSVPQYQQTQQAKELKKYSFAPSEPLSPITSNDDNQGWINELLAKSAPITNSNSFNDLNDLPQQYSNFDVAELSQTNSNLEKYFDNDSVFSGPEFFSSSETSQATSPHIKIEANEENFLPDLYSVNNKLETLQKSSDYTPKSLESIFDTKDILKDESINKNNRRSKLISDEKSSISKPTKKRNPRKRLTDTQKQAHNKIEKKYRININAKIAGLQQIIPWVASEKTAFETGKIDPKKDPANAVVNCNRLNKSMILEKATDYILYLQSNEQRIIQENLNLKKEILRLGGNADIFE
ncbi:HLH-domain-containing protein [Hyphopichia burtonii NRRL Y-1933]|uniref:HLH-domain-containing protein n=1 Tax=Hyphopichia burtonii NRRL Y-1933 TaxID=984485 RepID=A0A1E4RCF4_9ASCO|nr:HLH-domain-containing protein [Hyphopichia burtonii NRRL Y-1933]ODV64934.1 HLH-domain-containing protein [Hyphopichia burtonii NRRL Y-1933]